MVHSCIRRSAWRLVLVHPHQWLRRVPIPRRRNTNVPMGRSQNASRRRLMISRSAYHAWSSGVCASLSRSLHSRALLPSPTPTPSACSSHTCYSRPSALSSTASPSLLLSSERLTIDGSSVMCFLESLSTSSAVCCSSLSVLPFATLSRTTSTVYSSSACACCSL